LWVLILVGATLVGACDLAPGSCAVTIWGAGQTALDEGATIPPDMERLVGPEDIDWAASSLEAGNPPTLLLSLRPAAATRIADHTRENAGSYLAVAMKGKVVSAPVIMSTIEGGAIQLEGSDPASFAAFAPCVGK
jgi:preprotein translocase subunit SecD